MQKGKAGLVKVSVFGESPNCLGDCYRLQSLNMIHRVVIFWRSLHRYTRLTIHPSR